jgi:hypothetical protein
MIAPRIASLAVITGMLSLPQPGWAQAGSGTRVVRTELFRIPAHPAADDPAFHRIMGLQFGQSGEVLVLDHYRNSVRVFSPEGKLLREFGRRGQGPGEFLQPTSLHMTPRSVTVYDLPPAQRLTTFSHAGEYLATWTAPPQAGHSTSTAVGLRGGQVAVLTTPYLNEVSPGARTLGRLQIVDSTGRQAQLLAEFPLGISMAYYGTKSVGVAGPPGTGAVWAVLGDSVVGVTNAYTGTVEYWIVADSGVRRLRTRQLGWTRHAGTQRSAAGRATGRPAHSIPAVQGSRGGRSVRAQW